MSTSYKCLQCHHEHRLDDFCGDGDEDGYCKCEDLELECGECGGDYETCTHVER